MSNPYAVVKQFEDALCDYTGAPCCVTTTSCTMALLLALNWYYNADDFNHTIEIPKRPYVGVAMSILKASPGGRMFSPKLAFDDVCWSGEYELRVVDGETVTDHKPIWDSARRFTSGMYRPGTMQCLSFHWSKILSIGQGGAILLDDPEAAAWLRKARFDGRTEGEPIGQSPLVFPNYHAYMTPEQAALGLVKLSLLPEHNEDLPWGPGTNSDYPDLSKLDLFN